MKDRIRQFKGVETDKQFAPLKKSVYIDASTLQQYIGEYQLAPEFVIEITVASNRLFAQATNQPKFEIFPEKPDTFFLKVVEPPVLILIKMPAVK